MGHLEPWTATTAASQHGRGNFGYLISVTGPAPVPATLTSIEANEGLEGTPISAPVNGPLKVSPTFATTNDGCSAYAAGTFTGAVAVISRGGCTFSIKVNAATTAGAVAVIIANNEGSKGLMPLVAGTTIPVFGVTEVTGNALAAWHAAHSDATVSIGYPSTAFPNQVDQLADFSSRGPAGSLDLIKPDVTAPGVQILAAAAGATVTGFEQETGLKSGTSMAAPHNAGSSLLLRQLRPTWTVPEIKSALAMTAQRNIIKEDGVTPATPFDSGSGRIRVDRAANAGLVLDETKANFLAADPASGGNVSSLNLPSIASRSCPSGCQFVRTFRNTQTTSQNWTASLSGLTGTVSPSSFTVGPGATVAVTVSIDSSVFTPDGKFNFGSLDLVPAAGSPTAGDLSLPIAIAVQPPAITLVPAMQDVSLASGQTGTVDFEIRNDGGSSLNFNIDSTGNGQFPLYSAAGTGLSMGYRSTRYSDPGSAGSAAQLASDDIQIAFATMVRSIAADGFIPSGATIPTATTELRWSIYADANGLPAGDPVRDPGSALWTYSTTAAGPGVTIAGGSMKLDLAAAGQSISLPPGRYWVMVNTSSTFANRWAWNGSNGGTGGFATLTISTSGTGVWTPNNSHSGLAMQVEGEVACGSSWIGATVPASGSVAPKASSAEATQIIASGLAPNVYYGAVCVASNDPSRPKAAKLIRLTVLPNTTPTISDIPDTSTNDDTPTPPISFTVGDAETPAASLVVTATSSDQNVVADSGIALGGAGAARTITVTPVPNANGFADITVTVSDGELTASDVFRLTVNPVNDAPTISDIPNTSTDEDTPTPPISFTVGDAETPAASLVVTATSSDQNVVADSGIALGGAGATRTITVTPVPNANGFADITVTVSDGELTASDVFRLTVNPVNDAPTISDIPNTSTNEDTPTPPISFTVGDAETPVASLVVTATSSDQNVVADNGIALGGAGAARTITVTPVPNGNGFADITVTVSDGGLTASDVFRLTVNPVNDAPTIVGAAGIVRQQAAGASSSVIGTVSDIDDAPGALTVTVNGASSASVNGVTVSNISVGPNGSVTASISAGCGASNASFTLRVRDAGGLSAQTTLSVSVIRETTPPVIAPIANIVVTLPPGHTTSMPVSFPTPVATDNCPGVTVTTNPASGSAFNLGTTVVTVTAVDAVGNVSTSTFTVTVMYSFGGFIGRYPLPPPSVNYVYPGNAISIAFSLNGYAGMNIFMPGSPSSRQVTCPSGLPIGPSQPAVLNPPLTYFSGRYVMYWNTDPSWAGTCREYSMAFADGTTRTMNFAFYN